MTSMNSALLIAGGLLKVWGVVVAVILVIVGVALAFVSLASVGAGCVTPV